MKYGPRPLKMLWEVFDRGDHLGNDELEALAESAEEGLRYLRARGETLTAAKTAMDLNRIQDYQRSRRREAGG